MHTWARFCLASLTDFAQAPVLFGVLFLAGCGGSNSPDAASANQEKRAELPAAAIGGRSADAATQAASSNDAATGNAGKTDEAPLPQKGSPEWLLGQMIVLRASPLPEAQTPQQQEINLRERNEKIVTTAHEVIRKTHKDKSQESTFNGAVHFLVESRLQLALAGNKEQAQALSNDAQDLYKRDPNSAAAAEAAFGLARLAHTNARRFAKTDPRAIQDFAIQARLFASRFPTSDSRAIQLLSAAGQTCELYNMETDAVACFTLLQEKFPQTPQAEQATAVLRRLKLKGKRLELGGATNDRGFVKIDQLRGRPVLVVFWSSDSEPFQQMLPDLMDAIRKHERSGLAVLGVCLDDDEGAMSSFVEKNGINWKQIFSSDPAKRRWEHPLVQYYGVHNIPALWLVDQRGFVVDTHATVDTLDSQLRYLAAGDSARSRQ